MIDHLSLGTSDLARAMKFYDAALAPLGWVRVWTREDAAGYGPPGGEDLLAIKARENFLAPRGGFHLALTARAHEQVDEFHRAALENGGSDDGAPGFRPNCGAGYYAAFIADPDGHRLEAVCHSA